MVGKSAGEEKGGVSGLVRWPGAGPRSGAAVFGAVAERGVGTPSAIDVPEPTATKQAATMTAVPSWVRRVRRIA